MREISGDKYKLAGIEVLQKGTLVDVFAKFARVEENVDDILANKREPRTPAKPGTFGGVLDTLEPLPRVFSMPTLSVQEITEAIVGKRDIGPHEHRLNLTDKPGVIADLGPEKLAEVLVEMGRARKQVLTEGATTFVRQITAPQP